MINRTQYSPATSRGVYSAETSLAPKVVNSVLCSGMAPPCWLSKCHVTVTGPLTSMVPSNETGWSGPIQPATETVSGSILSVALVTKAVGGATTPIVERLPEAIVTLAATQH